jgi:hypothetical protein
MDSVMIRPLSNSFVTDIDVSVAADKRIGMALQIPQNQPV